MLALPVPVVTLAAALLGRSFDITSTASALVGTTVGVALLAFDFGLLALAVGAWTGSRSTAIGVAVSLAAVAYVVSALAPVVHWIHAVRFVSPFYWSVGANQAPDADSRRAALARWSSWPSSSVSSRSTGFRRLDIH